jgi:hypothetical protein
MNTLVKSSRFGGVQFQKRRMYYFAEEALQQKMGDPLLRKLDYKLR